MNLTARQVLDCFTPEQLARLAAELMIEHGQEMDAGEFSLTEPVVRAAWHEIMRAGNDVIGHTEFSSMYSHSFEQLRVESGLKTFSEILHAALGSHQFVTRESDQCLWSRLSYGFLSDGNRRGWMIESYYGEDGRGMQEFVIDVDAARAMQRIAPAATWSEL